MITSSLHLTIDKQPGQVDGYNVGQKQNKFQFRMKKTPYKEKRFYLLDPSFKNYTP